MAIINSILCVDGSNQSLNFNGQYLTAGTFLTATDAPPANDVISYCLEVTDGTDDTGSSLSATTETFLSCYDCLVNNYTVISIDFCDGSYNNLLIDISQFGYIPSENDVLFMRLNNTTNFLIGCVQVTSIGQYSLNNYNLLLGDLYTIDEIIVSSFGTCDDCLFGLSAGTESTMCVICCPCTSGETITTVSPPHPKWTNLQGQTTILLDAIQLGGMNGLNS